VKHVGLVAAAFLGVAGLAALAAGGDEDRDGPVDIPASLTFGEVRGLVQAMSEAVGLDAVWTAFMEAAALGESGFNPVAARGSQVGAPSWAKVYSDPNEALAAQRAYNRNSERYGECTSSNVERQRYQFGSGGLWALLPANGLAGFWGTELECMSPWAVFEPAPAFVMSLEMNRRIMKYSAFQAVPTFGNVRVGHRSTKKLGRASELERQRNGLNKLGDRLQQLDYSRELVDTNVTPLPARDPLGMLAKLQAVA